MNRKLGVPYMGSKRVLAYEIVNYITAQNPNCKYFYDLFGGGGAISFQALQHKNIDTVFYNEIDTGVVELIKKIRDEGVTDEFYKWIDRDTFHAHKFDNDWRGGLIKTCWSFGNNQKGYLFGEEIKNTKRLMHEVVVNCCENSRNELLKIGLNIPSSIFEGKTIAKRRLFLKKYALERIDLQQLQQLERLEQLERLGQLERLELTNLSYESVQINTPISETVIYLDPPYQSTAKYQNGIDHDKLLKWIKESPYKIYVSSYDFDLPLVKSINHRSSLSATNNAKKVVENLYCNREIILTKQLNLFS